MVQKDQKLSSTTERAITEKELFDRGWEYDKRGVLIPNYKVTGKGIKKNTKIMKHFNR